MNEHTITGTMVGPDGTAITTAERVKVVAGIVLPWVRVNGYTHVEQGRGEVFIPMNVLDELGEQDVWDSQFGDPCLLDSQQGMALEQAGLAVQETRGGYHRTQALVDLLKRENRF